MATKKVEDEMYVEEGADGAATIEMPEGMVPLEDGQEEIRGKSEDNDSGDSEDHPDDSEAVRAARRARRR